MGHRARRLHCRHHHRRTGAVRRRHELGAPWLGRPLVHAGAWIPPVSSSDPAFLVSSMGALRRSSARSTPSARAVSSIWPASAATGGSWSRNTTRPMPTTPRRRGPTRATWAPRCSRSISSTSLGRAPLAGGVGDTDRVYGAGAGRHAALPVGQHGDDSPDVRLWQRHQHPVPGTRRLQRHADRRHRNHRFRCGIGPECQLRL